MTTLVATLVTAAEPRPVQIVLDGVAAGVAFEVVGTTADGSSWPVPGGVGVSTGAQVVLVDNRSALNVPVTYQVTAAGVVTSATPVTVTSASPFVLQSLDGQTIVRPVLLSGDFPVEPVLRSAAVDVPGRSRPPARFATSGAGGGSMSLLTEGAETVGMRAILETGRPVVYRSASAIRDLPAVDLLLPSAVRSASMVDDSRVWSLSYLLVDDPEPSSALAAFTWDDFDAAVSSLVWTTTRTNRVAVPRGDASWGASLGGGTATEAAQATGGPAECAEWDRFTFTAAPTATTLAVQASSSATTSVPVTPGETVTASIRGISSKGLTMRAAIYWYDAAGASVAPTTTLGTSASVTAGAWSSRMSVTAVVPAGAAYARPAVYMNQSAVGVLVIGDYVGATAALLESGSVVRPYFDGSTPDTAGYTRDWTGAANASTSTETPADGSFDGMFADLTWDDFDTYDWGQLL